MAYNLLAAVRRGNPRAIARINGDKMYMPDALCPQGHISLRYTKYGQCLDCLKISKDAYRNSEKGKTKDAEYSKNYSKLNKAKSRAKIYGLTADDVEWMKILQNYRCKICENLFGNNPRNLHIDHCHKTNKVRGLLCHPCNVGLGHFKDNREVLIKAADYLKVN